MSLKGKENQCGGLMIDPDYWSTAIPNEEVNRHMFNAYNNIINHRFLQAGNRMCRPHLYDARQAGKCSRCNSWVY